MMSAIDSNGNAVGVGDVLIVTVESEGKKAVTVVKISETSKGVTAFGAYVDLVGHGRVEKAPIDVATGVLVLRRNGEVTS